MGRRATAAQDQHRNKARPAQPPLKVACGLRASHLSHPPGLETHTAGVHEHTHYLCLSQTDNNIPKAYIGMRSSPSSGLYHQGWTHLSLPSLQNIAIGRCAAAAAATTCAVAHNRARVRAALFYWAATTWPQPDFWLGHKLSKRRVHQCVAHLAGLGFQEKEGMLQKGAARHQRRHRAGAARLHSGADLWSEGVQNCLVHAQQPLPISLPATRGARLCDFARFWARKECLT